MKVTLLNIDTVYMCSDNHKDIHVLYNGMIEDRYMFTPVDPVKHYYCGIPNTLTEKEVTRLIQPI